MHPTTIDEARFGRFKEAYQNGLTLAHQTHPNDYLWPMAQIPDVVERMMNGVRKGTFNHGGHGFKNTCKALGIKHTRKAIIAFIEGK